jgi:MFS family permease
MVSTLMSFVALFMAEFLLLMGVGLLGTLLSLRMTLEGFSAQVTGLILAAYYVGLILGSFASQGLIRRVGHIRAFAAFAAVATTIVMLHGLYMSALVWGALRLATGMATIGLYMVVESWLNERTDPGSRGRVFSVYMLVTYLGMGIGQLLLNIGDPRGQSLFFVIGMLLALCLVPVAVTGSVSPQLPKTAKFNLGALLKKAPLGMLGCLSAGLINSAFYAMGPVFSHQTGLTVSGTAWFMAVTVFGGLVLQWPVGLLSDRCDRSIVVSSLGCLVAVVCILVIASAGKSNTLLFMAMVLYGGLAFTIYPVAVARTHDLFEPKDIVPVSSALLLCYSIGASVGPIGASSLMAAIKSPSGLFAFASIVSGLYGMFGFYVRTKEKVRVVPVAEQVQFVPMRNTSAVASALDPRAAVEAAGPREDLR